MESLFKYPMKLVVLVAWLSIVLDPCKFSDICETCHKDASCENVNGSKACLCHSGYTGNGISVCTDDDECQNITEICGSNAICTNTIGDYFCTCEHGFKSTGNETFKPNDDTHCVENLKKDCHLNDTCILKSINETLEYISNITEPLSILEEIQKQTSGHLSPVDVIKYVETLFLSLSSLSVVGVNATNSTITELLKAANNLVEKDEMVTWEKMGKETRKITITKLLHTVEDAALSISKNSKTATILEANRSDIALKLYAYDAQTTNKINLQATMQGDSIKLTSKTKHADVNGSISIVFLRYNSISNLLMSEASDPTVNSQIVAVALNPKNIYQLDHIEFTLKHSKPVDLEVNGTECAFWNYSVVDMRGHWAKEGCGRIFVNRSHTKCRCNHLTHFAILMSSGRADLSDNFNILTRITQLGMIISIICLSMCIFTFWFFSEIQSTRTTIHKNLCCSLFMAEFIYLVGINLYNHKLFCSIIAMLLHYFFLAAFAWMCIEGIHLYLIVVGVIYNKGFLHRNFYIFGYGSPAAVVLISATLGYKYYGTNKACWLSTENNFIWSFIGPACLIILVNLLAFVVIIYKVYHHTAVKKPEISHYENIRSCARGAIALLFVLGATWAFGVLHILNETTVTAYLFTISNAFQGMFIFIFLCVLSRKIQEEYYRLFKNVPCCFECLR